MSVLPDKYAAAWAWIECHFEDSPAPVKALLMFAYRAGMDGDK